jgi:hypothetical protein
LVPQIKVWTEFIISTLSSKERSGDPLLGTRKYNILHCQLRNLAISNLNQHKFLSHLSDGSWCPCGEDVEDNFHRMEVQKQGMVKRVIVMRQQHRGTPTSDFR